MPRSASARCARPSTGAMTCSRARSAARSRTWPSSPAGATVPAAETVTGASLDILDSLVAKQLLASRDERLLMLETVREYALERLAEDPNRDAVQERLASGASTFCMRRQPISSELTECPGWRSSTPNCRTPSRRCPRPSSSTTRNSPCSSSTRWATTGGTRITPKMPFAGSMPPWSWDATPPLACEPPRCSTGGASRTSGGQTSPTAMTCKPASSSTAPATTPRGIAACLIHLAFAETWVGNYEQATALSEQAVRYAERAQDEAGDRLCARQLGEVRGRLRRRRKPRPQCDALSAPRRQSRPAGPCLRDRRVRGDRRAPLSGSARLARRSPRRRTPA